MFWSCIDLNHGWYVLHVNPNSNRLNPTTNRLEISSGWRDDDYLSGLSTISSKLAQVLHIILLLCCLLWWLKSCACHVDPGKVTKRFHEFKGGSFRIVEFLAYSILWLKLTPVYQVQDKGTINANQWVIDCIWLVPGDGYNNIVSDWRRVRVRLAMCCIHPRVSYRDSQPYIVWKSAKKMRRINRWTASWSATSTYYNVWYQGNLSVYHTTEYDGVPVDTVGQIRVNQGGKYHKNKHSSFEEKGQGVSMPRPPTKLLTNHSEPMLAVALSPVGDLTCFVSISDFDLFGVDLFSLSDFCFLGSPFPLLSTSYVRIHFASYSEYIGVFEAIRKMLLMVIGLSHKILIYSSLQLDWTSGCFTAVHIHSWSTDTYSTSQVWLSWKFWPPK